MPSSIWILNPEDLHAVETQACALVRKDACALMRSPAYMLFRQRALMHLEGYGSMGTGDAVWLGSVVILVLGAHPENVLEVQVLEAGEPLYDPEFPAAD